MDDILDEDLVGPLAVARENSELFADSILQQTILFEVAEAIKVCQLSSDADALLDQAAKDQLSLLWTSIADEWYARGVSA